MKRKELKILAQKIVNAELIIRNSEDEKAVEKAKNDIIELSGKAMSLEDMLVIDEMVQEILSQKKLDF